MSAVLPLNSVAEAAPIIVPAAETKVITLDPTKQTRMIIKIGLFVLAAFALIGMIKCCGLFLTLIIFFLLLFKAGSFFDKISEQATQAKGGPAASPPSSEPSVGATAVKVASVVQTFFDLFR